MPNAGMIGLVSESKACARCGNTEKTRFGRCSSCKRVRDAAWDKANAEKRATNARIWAAAHPERRKAIRARWYQGNHEKALIDAREQSRRQRAANPEKTRAAVVRSLNRHPETKRRIALRKYGLTLADYDNLSKAQGGACSICWETPTGRLDVDHDHSTGLVRGLLCGRCNSALGLMKDDPARLTAAIAYLAKNATKPS